MTAYIKVNPRHDGYDYEVYQDDPTVKLYGYANTERGAWREAQRRLRRARRVWSKLGVLPEGSA